MSKTRKVSQIEADKFDLDLFNLMRRAEGFEAAAIGDPREWGKMARSLSGLRAITRAMMHPEDVKGTL